MNHGNDPAPDPAQPSRSASQDPYQLLGVAVDASFDEVQAARDARLQEQGEDPIARSRVEAAYDAILMNRLRERQQGRISTAARSASQREQSVITPSARPRPAAQPRLPQLPGPALVRSGFSLPSLEAARGRELWFPLLVFAVLVALLFLLPVPPAELLLSLATLATLLNLQRRSGRFLVSLGWSLGLLCLGLGLGAWLVIALASSLGLPLALVQIQSLPALLLLLLGALLIS